MYKANFSIDELISITNGTYIGENISGQRFCISTDTRTICADDTYLALAGENFDGHNFVENAFSKGVNLAIISKNNQKKLEHLNGNFLVVENTLVAFLEIASFHKNRCNAKIIAVTGSSGKTTTKEYLYGIFSSKYKTQKSIKNHNNEIGLCQTLLSIEPDTKYCIVEMGMRALNEIDLLAKYAKPQIAIITNVGTAHIGILGSQENIAKAKCEITNYLSNKDTLIAHNEKLIHTTLSGDFNKIFYDIDEIKIINKTANNCEFKYDNYIFKITDSAEYNILNALAGIKAAKLENYSNEEIQNGLLTFQNVEFRNEIITLKNGTTVISDCYNANPDSTKASIEYLKEFKNKKIVFVFGDMLELGEFEEKFHKEIGEKINNSNVNYFISVGKLAKITADTVEKIDKKSFETTKEAAEFINQIIDNNTLVFLKASRGMQFEKILEIVKGK